MSKCYFCEGKTKIKKVDVDFRWKGKLNVIKNVPVEICSQCGERYYSAEVSKKIDEIVKAPKINTKETIEVPVFNWQ